MAPTHMVRVEVTAPKYHLTYVLHTSRSTHWQLPHCLVTPPRSEPPFFSHYAMIIAQAVGVASRLVTCRLQIVSLFRIINCKVSAKWGSLLQGARTVNGFEKKKRKAYIRISCFNVLYAYTRPLLIACLLPPPIATDKRSGPSDEVAGGRNTTGCKSQDGIRARGHECWE